jgi:hypothetical protein
MGAATIAGGGAGGRYTLDLDFGEDQRVALLGSITLALNFVGQKIIDTQALIDQADAAMAAQRAKVDAEFALISSAGNNLPPGSPVPNTSAYQAELAALRKLEIKTLPFYINMRALKKSRANLLAKQTEYTQLITTEQRGAWCCDLTEDGSGVVATVDIAGESDLLLVAPACRPWAAADGYFRDRSLLSPEQCYYNAAVLPTWQKYKPTYRWGTVTAKNEVTNTLDVSLAATNSSAGTAPRVNVNQSPNLLGVSVEYMTCGAKAFTVGDRVVVRFLDQDWEQPVVIGFLDNPKACPDQSSYDVWYTIRTYPVLFNGPVDESAFGPGDGVQFWLSSVGYMNGIQTGLKNGDIYNGVNFPAPKATMLHIETRSLTESNMNLAIAGGVIAGKDISWGATYATWGATYNSAGYSGISFHTGLGWSKGYRLFLSPDPVAGETQSGYFGTSDAAAAWMPSTQSYEFAFNYAFLGNPNGSIVFRVKFDHSGGDIWNITSVTRVN